jgi:hypothetical protein
MEPVKSYTSVGGPQAGRHFKPVPSVYLEKYFGREDFNVQGAKRQAFTRNFLAKQLKVDPKTIEFDENGGLLLDRSASFRITKGPVDDSSFLLNGGRVEAVYEGVEMAYNDVMAGTVEAGGNGLTTPVREVARKIGGALPDSVRSMARSLRESGALEILTGVGAGGAAGLGLWLGYSGAKQATQGIARGDTEQTVRGARHLFLGSESLLTAAVLAARVSSHAVLQAAGAVALQLATPFALVHGAIDIAEGVGHLKQGVKNKDRLSVLEGVAELGMGVGWTVAAFGATPALVAVSCACLAGKLGVAVVRHRRQKKERKELIADHEKSRTDQVRHLEQIGEKNLQLSEDSPLMNGPSLTVNNPDSDSRLAVRFEPALGKSTQRDL